MSNFLSFYMMIEFTKLLQKKKKRNISILTVFVNLKRIISNESCKWLSRKT